MGTTIGLVTLGLTFFQAIDLSWSVSIMFFIIFVIMDYLNYQHSNNIHDLALACDNEIDSIISSQIEELQEQLNNFEEEIDGLKEKIEDLEENVN